MTRDYCFLKPAVVLSETNIVSQQDSHLPGSLTGQPFPPPTSVSACVFSILLHRYADSVKLASEEKWHQIHEGSESLSLCCLPFSSHLQSKGFLFSWSCCGTLLFPTYSVCLQAARWNFDLQETTTCKRTGPGSSRAPRQIYVQVSKQCDTLPVTILSQERKGKTSREISGKELEEGQDISYRGWMISENKMKDFASCGACASTHWSFPSKISPSLFHHH